MAATARLQGYSSDSTLELQHAFCEGDGPQSMTGDLQP